MEYKKVILLVPLTFNDGSTVPDELLKKIRSEIFGSFGGYTIAGEVHGAYRMQTGQKQEDRLVQIWITVEDSRREELRRMVAKFGSWLGQETMYFETTQSMVELIRPSNGEEPHEQRDGNSEEG